MELIAKDLVREVPDFPKQGILFYDITPVLQHGRAFAEVVEAISEQARELKVDLIVGIESRGFIFGAPVASRMGIGFVPIRKLGKLPFETIQWEYALEYGTNTMEIHRDAVRAGQRVLIVDDLLATGGTAAASASLVEKLGGKVAAFSFVVELEFLNGREALSRYEVRSLLRY